MLVGGGGYIGTHLHALLRRNGYRVSVIDPRPTPLPCDDVRHNAKTCVFLAWPHRHEQERLTDLEHTRVMNDLYSAAEHQLNAGRDMIFISSVQAQTRPSLYGQEKFNFEMWLATNPWPGSVRVVRPCTVYGLSPHPRWDTILNQMVLEALTTKVVRANGKVHRSLVSLEMLNNHIVGLIAQPMSCPRNPAATFHASIPLMASTVAEETRADLRFGEAPGWLPDDKFGCGQEEAVRDIIRRYVREVRTLLPST